MNPGLCYVAERSDPSQTVKRIVDSFSREGIVLVNSYTGRVTELAGDGEQVETTEADLVKAAAARQELTFQFWLSDETDWSCGFRQIADGIVRHGYSADGLDAQERRLLFRWAVDYFRAAAVAGTAIMLVVDPPGVTADVDWDGVARGTVPLPPVLPAILGLPASWTSHMGAHSGYSRELILGFELLTSTTSSGSSGLT